MKKSVVAVVATVAGMFVISLVVLFLYMYLALKPQGPEPECREFELCYTPSVVGDTGEIEKSWALVEERLALLGAEEVSSVIAVPEGHVRAKVSYAGDWELVRRAMTASGNLSVWETYGAHEFKSELLPVLAAIGEESAVDGGSNQLLSVLKDNSGYAGAWLCVQAADTACVSAQLNTDKARALLPQEFCYSWSVSPVAGMDNGFELYLLKRVNGASAMSGSIVKRARRSYDTQGHPLVEVQLLPDAAERFRKLTSCNVGRAIAIVVDGKVYSAPVVQCEIEVGRFQIPGNFGRSEVDLMAAILSYGPLSGTFSLQDETARE